MWRAQGNFGSMDLPVVVRIRQQTEFEQIASALLGLRIASGGLRGPVGALIGTG
jgi:hypothetical protein